MVIKQEIKNLDKYHDGIVNIYEVFQIIEDKLSKNFSVYAGPKKEKIKSLIRYLEAYDYNNLTTLILPKEDASYLLEALREYNKKLWTPYVGQNIKEGVYNITFRGVDAITKEEKYFVTDCLYSELHNAFMGYGAYPNTRVVAFKEKDKPYMPEKRTRKSRRFRKRLTSS